MRQKGLLSEVEVVGCEVGRGALGVDGEGLSSLCQLCKYAFVKTR